MGIAASNPVAGGFRTKTMLEEYNFELDRINGVHAVMQLVATFLPDDKAPAAVATMITDAIAVRDGTYLQRHAEKIQADAQFNGSVTAVHDACVSVHGAMRSRYRKDKVSMESIDRIPTQDQSINETRHRGEVLLRTWKLLPLPADAPVQPPPPPHYYIPHDGMNVAAFTTLATTMTTKEAAAKTADGEWEKAEALLHEQDRLLHDFNVAASAQGRAQFPDLSSVERELIESIPEEPPVSAPGTAVITSASSVAPGEARIKVTCARASRFDWEKMVSGGSWETLATNVPLSLLLTTGLDPGNTSFRVKGKNSRGESEWSEPAEITVS